MACLSGRTLLGLVVVGMLGSALCASKYIEDTDRFPGWRGELPGSLNAAFEDTTGYGELGQVSGFTPGGEGRGIGVLAGFGRSAAPRWPQRAGEAHGVVGEFHELDGHVDGGEASRVGCCEARMCCGVWAVLLRRSWLGLRLIGGWVVWGCTAWEALEGSERIPEAASGATLSAGSFL